MIRALVPLLLLALLAPAGAAAQDDLAAALDDRREGASKAKRSFQETWLVPATATATPEFAARVTVRQERGRERIEIRTVANGALGDPVVVVGDGRAYWLLTRVGAAPLAGSAPARDPLVGMVLASPAGDAPPHRRIAAADGAVRAVVLRHALAGDFDSGDAFAVDRAAALDGGGLPSGLAALSAGGNSQATAAAGPRGAARIRTATGEVDVEPDPAAVEWMNGLGAAPVELETFKAEAGLAPYDALPADSAAAGAR